MTSPTSRRSPPRTSRTNGSRSMHSAPGGRRPEPSPPSILRRDRARQHALHDLLDGHALMQDFVDMPADRHVDAMPLRDFMHGLRRVIALDDLPDLGDRLLDRLARGERAAEPPVARLV